MNMTTEIFRKAVIVTMINGNSPRAVRKMIIPTVLGASFIAGKAHDSYTEAVPNLHQRAAAQPPAVSHDVERLVGRAAQRHQRARRQALELAKRKLDTAEFEDEPHRQVVHVRIVQAGRAGKFCRITPPPPGERPTPPRTPPAAWWWLSSRAPPPPPGARHISASQAIGGA